MSLFTSSTSIGSRAVGFKMSAWSCPSLRDPMLVDEVNKLIASDRINAEWAVRRVSPEIKHLFDWSAAFPRAKRMRRWASKMSAWSCPSPEAISLLELL